MKFSEWINEDLNESWKIIKVQDRPSPGDKRVSIKNVNGKQLIKVEIYTHEKTGKKIFNRYRIRGYSANGRWFEQYRDAIKFLGR